MPLAAEYNKKQKINRKVGSLICPPKIQGLLVFYLPTEFYFLL